MQVAIPMLREGSGQDGNLLAGHLEERSASASTARISRRNSSSSSGMAAML